MTVVAVTGGQGAPGATATALALLLTWPLSPGRRVILLEADPDGGSVLAGALQGRVSAEYGLHQLGVAHRQGNLVDSFFRQLVDLSDGRRERLLLPGFTDPAQASGLAYTWDPLSRLLAGLEHQQIPHDVILDLGRRGTTGASAILARRADVVLPVVRGTLASLAQARPRVAALRHDLETHGTGGDGIGLVLIEQGRYPRQEIGRQLGTPVLGLIPYEPERARALSDGEGDTGKRFLRSRLLRAARTTAEAAIALGAQRRMRLAPRATGTGASPAGAVTANSGWAQAAAYIRRQEQPAAGSAATPAAVPGPGAAPVSGPGSGPVGAPGGPAPAGPAEGQASGPVSWSQVPGGAASGGEVSGGPAFGSRPPAGPASASAASEGPATGASAFGGPVSGASAFGGPAVTGPAPGSANGGSPGGGSGAGGSVPGGRNSEGPAAGGVSTPPPDTATGPAPVVPRPAEEGAGRVR